MAKLVVSEFVSVDGVMEDPGGSEGWARGGWVFQFNRGDEGDRFKHEELMSADALLLGRKTYEGFAAAWPSRQDEAGCTEYVFAAGYQHGQPGRNKRLEREPGVAARFFRQRGPRHDRFRAK